MKIFSRTFWTAPLVGFYWVRAQDLRADSKHKKVLVKLKRIQQIVGRHNTRPMGGLSADYYLMQGGAYYLIGELVKASESFNKAVHAIRHSKLHSDDEKNYLLAYIASCHDLTNLSIEDLGELESINLEKIRVGIKQYFPLTAHPDWKIEEDKEDNDKELSA